MPDSKLLTAQMPVAISKRQVLVLCPENQEPRQAGTLGLNTASSLGSRVSFCPPE